ncbi:MAG: LytTR family DNA-binding domain-containing protein [Bacteroidota bacterium]
MPSLNFWLIEDEPPAMRRLERLLAQLRPDSQISFKSDTVEATLQACEQQQIPDIIFSDIQLADGLSFDIWEEAQLGACPIVFTTAFDQYSLRAFQVNGIDYLLKPIEPEQLKRALDKHERLTQIGQPQVAVNWQQLAQLIEQRQPVYRERFLVQHRQDWLPLQVNQLRQIYSQDSLTFVIDTEGQRYMLGESLDRLEQELDPKQWFRINRSQIIHLTSVQKVSAYFNHRLKLSLSPAAVGDNVVSRQRVKACRAWLGQG